MSQQDLQETGVERDLEVQVDHLARLAQQSGLDGVVCSAEETQRLRQSLGDRFLSGDTRNSAELVGSR